MDKNAQQKLAALIQLELDGSLSDDQFGQMSALLKSSPQARRYYARTISMISLFRSSFLDYALQETVQAQAEDSFDSDLWQALSLDEKQADPICSPKASEPLEIIADVRQRKAMLKEKKKVSRLSIFVLVVNAAAMLFLVLFIKFAPSKQTLEVASLSGGINAKWADKDTAMTIGTRLVANREKLLLREGLAEITFDNHAKVVIEAPAEFQILAEDRIGLNYGKVYSTVPPSAIGFSIYTSIAKIIDLGTEFGVAVDMFGDISLHVMGGKTALLVDHKSSLGSVEVTDGMAKKVLAATSAIVDIPYDSQLFVRTFDSDNHLVWKGQKTLSLADIVGGGNGFGTGTIDMSIDPLSGKPSRELQGRRRASNDYRLVPSNPYIDGIFVPDGRTPQVISSQGHLFRECPATSGLCCDNIMNIVRNLDLLVTQQGDVSDVPVHAIAMHANMGITFDMQALRSLLPDVTIARFQSQFGIRKWALRPDASNADFWILVDGELRSQQKHVKINEFYSVDIELSEKDRFLTLILTEGDDPKERIWKDMVLTPIDSDWGMFVDPILVLESK